MHRATFRVQLCCTPKVALCMLKTRTVESRTQQVMWNRTTSHFMRLVVRKIKGCHCLHGPTMVSSSLKVAASIRKKCMYLADQPVINSKPGSTPNPFPGPFAMISSPSALSHKTKTATILHQKHQQWIVIYFAQLVGFTSAQATRIRKRDRFLLLVA